MIFRKKKLIFRKKQLIPRKKKLISRENKLIFRKNKLIIRKDKLIRDVVGNGGRGAGALSVVYRRKNTRTSGTRESG